MSKSPHLNCILDSWGSNSFAGLPSPPHRLRNVQLDISQASKLSFLISNQESYSAFRNTLLFVERVTMKDWHQVQYLGTVTTTIALILIACHSLPSISSSTCWTWRTKTFQILHIYTATYQLAEHWSWQQNSVDSTTTLCCSDIGIHLLILFKQILNCLMDFSKLSITYLVTLKHQWTHV